MNSGQHEKKKKERKLRFRNVRLCDVHSPYLCNKLQSENKIIDFCNKGANISSRCVPGNREVAHHVRGVEFHGGLAQGERCF